MNSSGLSNNAESYIPKKDVIETLEDGRTIQIAVKGVPMPLAEARKLGLLKTDDETDADEKAKTPAQNKAKAPAENK